MHMLLRGGMQFINNVIVIIIILANRVAMCLFVLNIISEYAKMVVLLPNFVF